MAERSTRYLQAAADRVMIQDLIARYAWEIDHGTPAAWAALFTSDGVFEVPVMQLVVRGRDDLVRFADDLQRTIPNVHHVTTSCVIDLEGERARGRCELNEFMARPEGVLANLQGWYEDDYRLDGDDWRIARRRVFVAEPKAGTLGRVGEYFAPFLEACRKYRRPRSERDA